jgi:hypothetical protein
MKISGQLLWTDYLKAQYLHMRPSTVGSSAVYVLLGFFVLAALASMAFSVGSAGFSDSWPFFLPPLLVIAILPLYFYVFLPRRVRRLFEQHKELSAPVEHEITPEGLITKSQYGNSNRPWSIFSKWRENKDLLMLYVTDIQFVMIPKRLCTAEQLAAVHSYLDQNKVLEASKVRTRSWARTAMWILLLLAIMVAFYVGFLTPTR